MSNLMVGEIPSLDCRHDASEEVPRTLRCQQILGILEEYPKGLNAWEIAEIMYDRKMIPFIDRNFVAPRLSEMDDDGRVEQVDKRKAARTGKVCAVFAIRNET